MRLQTLAAVIVILASWLLAATGNALMEKEAALCGIVETSERLRRHLMELTVKIGERSVYFPENLLNAAEYIETSYRAMGLEVERQEYSYADMTAVNIVSSIDFSEKPTRTYVLGAHYDSVDGTVGADDNASAIAVQIETARRLVQLREKGKMNLRVVFVSFALEEPPVFSTAFMGSRIFARRLRETKTDIEGMICLEMVGYTCDIPGCQGYPLPFFQKLSRHGQFYRHRRQLQVERIHIVIDEGLRKQSSTPCYVTYRAIQRLDSACREAE